MQHTYPDLDTYKREVFAREDDLLKSIMPDAAERGMPRISVSPEAGQTLYLLAKTIGAKKILEFGALAGYSGIWLARALPEDGQFITLEIDPKHAEVTRRNCERAGLSDRTDVRLGDGAILMKDAAQDGPFDLEHTRPGGLIIADNANGHGHAHRALSEGDGRRGIQDYNRRVADHPKLISNIIPVGGWLAVSLVLA